MTLDNISLGKKALIPLAVLTTFFAIAMGLGVVRLNSVSAEYANLVEHSNVAIVKTMRANRLAAEIGYATHVILDFQADNPQSIAAQESFKKSPHQAQSLLKEAAALWPQFSKELLGFAQMIRIVGEEAQKPNAIALAVPGVDAGAKLTREELEQLAKAAKLLNVIDANLQRLAVDITAFNDRRLAEIQAASTAIHESANWASWLMIGVGVAAAIVGVILSILMTNANIVKPVLALSGEMKQIAADNLDRAIDTKGRGDEIGDMARALETLRRSGLDYRAAQARALEDRERVERERKASEAQVLQSEREMVAGSIGAALARLSDKDLTSRLTEELPDAYRRLQADFNSALAQLGGALEFVADGAKMIGAATSEITQAADDLSRRTEQQAAGVEETVASISEITGSVEKTAAGAKHASTAVSQARSEAEKSGEVVARAIEAIRRIERSSQNIAQIIGTIDEIAFQTNLLALNAGVEAARAGESGRGFAVVASEVRLLAQRSAEAAKEIKALISVSNHEVADGVTLVLRAGDALGRIVDSVSEIDAVVAEIAEGAVEQAMSLKQINIAVSQVDQDVQKNAAMVEETTAATHKLKQETVELIASISGFTLASTGSRRAAAATPASRRPAARKAVGGGYAPAPRQAASEDWTEF